MQYPGAEAPRPVSAIPARRALKDHRNPPIMNRLLAAAALLVLSAAAGAQALVAGEVKKIDKPQSRIMLRHDEIKQFDMPPLTGTYKVSDPAMLERVHVGDRVRFSLDRVNNQYTITRIDVVK
jgi:Cu/Ag efflux protein CusF